jgi:hypothetical protein
MALNEAVVDGSLIDSSNNDISMNNMHSVMGSIAGVKSMTGLEELIVKHDCLTLPEVPPNE